MTLERSLLEAFVVAHPMDAATILAPMASDEIAEVFEAVPAEATREVLRFLPPLSAARAVQCLSLDRGATILRCAPPWVAAQVLRVSKADTRAGLLERFPERERRELQRQLRYPEGTAGAVMDSAVLAVPHGVTVGQALDGVRTRSDHAVDYIYVVGEDHELIGLVDLPTLVAADVEQAVGAICTRDVEAIAAQASWEAIVAHPGWRRLHALPVVESDGRFMGVVPYETERRLEQALLELADEGHGAQAAGALGEVYGLGVRGILRWAGGLFQDPTDRRQS